MMIQVIWFKTTGKRVFLMAPIHHHFEMMEWTENKIIVRFWIAAAIFGAVGLRSLLPLLQLLPMSRTATWWWGCALGAGGLRGDRSRCGPDAQVVATDRSDASTGEGLRPPAPNVARGDAVSTWLGSTAVIKSPGVPGSEPTVAARAGCGRARVERGGAGVADAREPDRRHHRHQRQDDDHRAGRRDAARAGTRRRGRRQRRPRADRAARPHRSRRVDRLRALELPARGHRHASTARGRRDPQHHARSPRPARHPRGVRALQAAAAREPDARPISRC